MAIPYDWDGDSSNGITDYSIEELEEKFQMPPDYDRAAELEKRRHTYIQDNINEDLTPYVRRNYFVRE